MEDPIVSQNITADLLPQRFSRWGKRWTAILVVICAFGAYAYFLQLKNGLVVTSMRDYATWGIYISNFVFFVAISLVGSLITAV
ncbi:MAG: polysulfide reductase, partial [Bacteroidota bacterium]|nr:polysulfide reductase [Bacteroidota bacterium]